MLHISPTQLVLISYLEIDLYVLPNAQHMQNIYLPRELACKIIELQVSIQEAEGLNRNSILELIECYTNAVQFYNQKGDDKRNLYYQRKMQDFLQQPSITEVLQRGKKSELTLRKQKNEEQIRRMSNQSQLLAKKLMENSSAESKKQEIVIKQNLAKQQQTLQERIQRKRANSNRVQRPKLVSASFTCGSDNKEDEKKIMNTNYADLPFPQKKQN